MDASVAVKIFAPEVLSAEAQAVFARFAQDNDAELIVPDLFFIECANVFWKWVQRSTYPAKAAQEHLRDLTGLGLTAVPVQVLAEDALDIAMKHRITAYDACYIAAASQLRLPLITADQKLVRQVAKGSYEVQWLGDVRPVLS
ncbi:MAG: type II toxin-antitoxin system VapC family toxin [Acidiferrobacteraceae bacterium]